MTVEKDVGVDVDAVKDQNGSFGNRRKGKGSFIDRIGLFDPADLSRVVPVKEIAEDPRPDQIGVHASGNAGGKILRLARGGDEAEPPSDFRDHRTVLSPPGRAGSARAALRP